MVASNNPSRIPQSVKAFFGAFGRHYDGVRNDPEHVLARGTSAVLGWAKDARHPVLADVIEKPSLSGHALQSATRVYQCVNVAGGQAGKVAQSIAESLGVGFRPERKSPKLDMENPVKATKASVVASWLGACVGHLAQASRLFFVGGSNLLALGLSATAGVLAGVATYLGLTAWGYIAPSRRDRVKDRTSVTGADAATATVG